MTAPSFVSIALSKNSSEILDRIENPMMQKCRLRRREKYLKSVYLELIAAFTSSVQNIPAYRIALKCSITTVTAAISVEVKQCEDPIAKNIIWASINLHFLC